jgi:hypothetical protein
MLFNSFINICFFFFIKRMRNPSNCKKFLIYFTKYFLTFLFVFYYRNASFLKLGRTGQVNKSRLYIKLCTGQVRSGNWSDLNWKFLSDQVGSGNLLWPDSTYLTWKYSGCFCSLTVHIKTLKLLVLAFFFWFLLYKHTRTISSGIFFLIFIV